MNPLERILVHAVGAVIAESATASLTKEQRDELELRAAYNTIRRHVGKLSVHDNRRRRAIFEELEDLAADCQNRPRRIRVIDVK